MKANIKLTQDDLQLISLFENMTRARVHDCLVDASDKRIIYIVKTGHLGLAIGRNGSKINQVRQLIGREVEIVEYNKDPKLFIRNCLAPARIKKVEMRTKRDGQQLLTVTVDPKDRGLAIGKAGKTIAKARRLVQRHFGIQNVIIE
jgi:N utilization substance protein A